MKTLTSKSSAPVLTFALTALFAIGGAVASNLTQGGGTSEATQPTSPAPAAHAARSAGTPADAAAAAIGGQRAEAAPAR